MSKGQSKKERTADYKRETLSIDLKPQHTDEWNRLIRLLDTSSGFQMVFLQYNEPVYRDAIIKKLRNLDKKSFILSTDMEEFPTFHSFEEKLKKLCTEFDIIHLVSLENWLFIENPKSMIIGFNYHRESIADNCHASLLMWMTEPDIKTFAMDAPDMWAWRSAVLEFKIKKSSLVSETITETIMDLIPVMPLKARVKRINEIKEFLDNLPKDFSSRIHAALLLELGLLFYHISKHDDALKYYNESLFITKEIGNRRGEADALNSIGEIYRAWGKNEDALKYLNESLFITKEVGDRQREATALNNIGLIYDSRGKYEDALKYFNESLFITKEVGHRKGGAEALNNIGAIYLRWGKYEVALKYYNESLIIIKEVGHLQGEASILNNIGAIYLRWGKYEDALKYFNESLIINKEVGHRQGEASILNNIGTIYHKWGKYEDALKYFNESLIINKEVGHRKGEAGSLNNIGKIYLEWGKYEDALKHFNESLIIKKEVDDYPGEATVLSNIGSVYLEWGKYEDALKYFNESLFITKEVDNRQGEATISWNIGIILKDRDMDKALPYFENALEIEKDIKSPDYKNSKKFVEALKKKL